MKNILKIILACSVIAACGESPKKVVNMRDYERKQMESFKKEMEKNNKIFLKHSLDSMKAILVTEAPKVEKGYFKSKDVGNLPIGTIIKFKPSDLEDLKAHTFQGKVYNGPYMCIIKGEDGTQRISNITYNTWLMLDIGDEIKN